MKVWQSSNFC